MTDLRPRSWPPLLSLLLLALLLVPAAPEVEAAPARRTLLQRLRTLIGVNPRQAVGGSRSAIAPMLCLITPRWHTTSSGSGPAGAEATVALPRPTLLASGALNEIQIERKGELLWQRLASSSTPITGPIPWPLQPLAPGERLLLRLRPRGSSGGEFATLTLQAAPAAEQQRAEALLAPESRRLAVIEQEAGAGRSALASEMVFAPLAAPPPELLQLRQELVRQGCGE